MRVVARMLATYRIHAVIDDTLDHAAGLMIENKATHLIVVEPRSSRPIGVLSTLDLARVLGELP